MALANKATVYNECASKNRFLLIDSVHFKNTKDSVMVVTVDDYDSCLGSHPIFFFNNSDKWVRLDW
uniref:Phytocyanin domain-containing protein n=1 Tax=Oryza brachyantha TaxID=4533 RepID=J3L0H9_ORYBR